MVITHVSAPQLPIGADAVRKKKGQQPLSIAAAALATSPQRVEQSAATSASKGLMPKILAMRASQARGGTSAGRCEPCLLRMPYK